MLGTVKYGAPVAQRRGERAHLPSLVEPMCGATSAASSNSSRPAYLLIPEVSLHAHVQSRAPCNEGASSGILTLVPERPGWPGNLSEAVG